MAASIKPGKPPPLTASMQQALWDAAHRSTKLLYPIKGREYLYARHIEAALRRRNYIYDTPKGPRITQEGETAAKRIMTHLQFRKRLKDIGWTTGELARQLQCSGKIVQNMAAGHRAIPPEVKRYLETLASGKIVKPPEPTWVTDGRQPSETGSFPGRALAALKVGESLEVPKPDIAIYRHAVTRLKKYFPDIQIVSQKIGSRARFARVK